MMAIRNLVLGFTLSMALVGSQANATDYTALRNDKRVHDELLAAGIAYTIDEVCPELTGRMVFALFRALELQSYARKLGYTNKELLDYVNSKEEQARFRAIGLPILKAQGVDPDDPESMCAFGREQIKRGTLVGQLLREK